MDGSFTPTSIKVIFRSAYWHALRCKQVILLLQLPRAGSGLRGCKNRPTPFPGRMSYKATKPCLVLFLYLSMLWLYCCLLGPFLCTYIVNFSWYVFCLLVVLVKLLLLAKWLARKIPLMKPNRGERIISIKPRLKRSYDCVGLLYSFIVLLHDICVIHFLLLWHDIAYLCCKCRKTPTNYYCN